MNDKLIDCLKDIAASLEKLNDNMADAIDCLEGVSLHLGDINENLERVNNNLFMLEHQLREVRKANEK